MTKRMLMILPAVLALALLAGACGGDEENEDQSGIANPASVYCEEQGGTLDLESGMCSFPDGSQCEEWAFFRGECSPGAAGDEASVGGMQIANPASAYCVEQGGTSETRTADDGGQYGVCVFPDGSEYDEWELYRGEVSIGS